MIKNNVPTLSSESIEQAETCLQDILAFKDENTHLNNEVRFLQEQLEHLEDQLLVLEADALLSDKTLGVLDHEGSQFETWFNQHPIATLLIDRHLTVLRCNEKVCDMLESNSHDFTNKNLREVLAERSLNKLFNITQKCHMNGMIFKCDDGLAIFKSGLLASFNLSLLVGSTLEEDRYLLSFNPLKMQSYNQQSLHIANNLIDQVREGVLVTDEKGRIIKVNHSFSDITGYSEHEVLGKTPKILHSGRQDSAFYKNMWAKIHEHGWWSGEIWNKRKSGEIYPEWLQISRIVDDLTGLNFYAATFSDITSRKEQRNQMERLAFYDVLTGLPNRSLLQNFLSSQLLRIKETNKLSLAVMFLDLDKFKEVNDRYGHAEGDMVLKEATQRLISKVRDNDMVARIGGDEFIIVLSRIRQEQDVFKLAEALIETLSLPYNSTQASHRLSASAGIAFYPKDGKTSEDLMRRADVAMYQVKNSGRNGYQAFKPEFEANSQFGGEIAKLVWQAIEEPRKFIKMQYQPIYSALNGQLHELEALVRLTQEQDTLIYPNKFIDIVEQNGLMKKFGLAIFERICEDVSDSKLPEGFKVGVNLSVIQFQSSFLVQDLEAIASQYGLTLKHFNFEVTETATMQNLSVMTAALSELQRAGCHILLDDFGTGYASLSMLKNLPVNVLKIDMSFITELQTSEDSRSLVTGMIAMAKALKLEIITEGVETQWQLDWLNERGVDYIQGYLLGKPKFLNELGLAKETL